MNVNQGTVGSDPVILATAGYDHTVRFWQAHSGICTRTVQHQDSQVNSLEVTPDRSMIAAAGCEPFSPIYPSFPHRKYNLTFCIRRRFQAAGHLLGRPDV
uniref:Target of rapamycin complex subunit lst8 n=1 Tax=Astatotilapia calliptera TaxID=8154 RepID=A0AAX7SGN8_ASTCA